MRSDLDPAKGIVWSVLACLLLWAVAGSSFAASFLSCSAPAAGVEGCGAVGTVDAIDVEATTVLGFCHDATQGPHGEAGCTAFSWDYWSERASYGAAALDWPFEGLLLVNDSEGLVYAAGGSLGGGGSEGEEVDLEQFGRAFAGAFLLVAAFWALGKGPALIINLLRR